MSNPAYVTSVVDTNTVKRSELGMFELFRRKPSGRMYAHVGKATVPPSAAVQYKSVIVQGSIGLSADGSGTSDGLSSTNNGDARVYPCGQAHLNLEIAE